MMARILLIAALLAGCTDFATIDRGVCGNGLLEPGEDCDSGDARCVRCAVTCSARSDCPTIDYTCGVDGLCHAPGGGLAAPHSAGTFQASDLRVTDVDHDGLGDAMGLSRTSVVVRHGEATGQLGTLDSLVTPTQTGPAALGDLDGDGSLDLTLTTADGLVSYASPFGELAPIAVNSALIDKSNGAALDFRAFFHIAPPVLAGFIVDPTSDTMAIVAIDGSPNSPGAPVFAYPCAARLGGIKSNTFDPATLDIYNVSKDTADQFDALVSFVTTGTPRRLCVLAVHRSAPAFLQPFPTITVTDVTPPGFGVPAKKPVFADLDTDSDPCPGLVKTDGGPNALGYFDGSQPSNTAACTLGTTSSSLPALGAPPNASIIGSGPVSPTVAFVAADALFTSEGVYPYLPNGVPLFSPTAQFSVVYRSTRTYARVAHGDFDGDGNVDAVLSAASDQDLDVLFRVPNQAGFNLVRIDTTSDVTTLTVGDYDGNRIADIAYTENLGDHQRLLVAFGTPDRPLDPVSVGVFAGVLDVSRFGFPDSVDYLSLADDLLVLQPAPSGSTVERVAILHGSPQRTLLSYFDPRPDNLRNDSVFRGAVIGNFVASGAATELPDLLAVAPPTASASGTPGKDLVRAYRVPNTADGLDGTAAPGLTIDGLVDCSLARTGKLCLDAARYVAFPTGPQHDVVIGIDRSNAAVMVDPWATTVTATTLDKLTSLVPAMSSSQSLQIGDLDGDGSPELIAAFAPTAAESPGAVIVCTMAAGIAASCQDVVPAILAAAATGGPAVTQCFDAAPARISYRDPSSAADASSDLAVACRGDGTSIFRVRHDVGGVVVDRLASTGAQISALRAGDVTGDQVDDLLLLEGDAVTSLVVYPQCTSRDAVSCRATSTGDSP